MAHFITVEGGDGSGKSTLLSKIDADFQKRGISYIKTREPGGPFVSEDIREVLLKPGRSIQALTELFLYEASRHEHVYQIIKPALENNQHVICDRFIHSTKAYQGAARGLDLKLIDQMNTLACGGIKPTLTIWLRVPVAVAKQRILSRGDQSRIDGEGNTFHEKVFCAFEEMVQQEPQSFIVLDASQPPQKVADDLLNDPRWIALFGNAAP